MPVEHIDAEPPSNAPTIKISEEVATVSKRERTVGRVRVSTKVDNFEEIARATLEGTTVDVTRVPVDRIVDELPQIRTEGDLTVIPVVEEVLVVEKRLMLKEEIRILTVKTTKLVEEPVTLRRQNAAVERFDEESPGLSQVGSADRNLEEK